MRRCIKYQQMIGMMVVLWTLMSYPSLALEDAIIAVVNDEVITLKDLKDYIHKTYVELVAEGIDEVQLQGIMADLENNGINKLIEDKLILSKANALGIDVRDKLVDERMAKIKSKYPSEQVFVDALIQHGATITDLRNKILDQLKIKFVIEHEVKSKIYINPQEVTDYYSEHPDDFRKKDRVNLQSIYIAFLDDKQKARQRAQEAWDKVQKGEDFGQVAQQYSDMPSVGVVERGQLLSPIEEIVFNLNDDEVSAPLDTETGIYVFKLVGRISAETAPLTEVKDYIYNLLYAQKFKDRYSAWLEQLKKDAYVEIKR